MEKTSKIEEIMKRESTHLQWNKISLNWGMFFSLVILTMMRKFEVERCTGPDWLCLFLLVVAAAVNTMLGVRTLKKEYEEKVEAGY